MPAKTIDPPTPAAPLSGLLDALRDLIQQGQQQALRRELSWTHYRLLLRISTESQDFYIDPVLSFEAKIKTTIDRVWSAI